MKADGRQAPQARADRERLKRKPLKGSGSLLKGAQSALQRSFVPDHNSGPMGRSEALEARAQRGRLSVRIQGRPAAPTMRSAQRRRYIESPARNY